jgi:hypothetical protein
MIEAGLELTIAQIAEIPTGREPIRFGFWVALGSAYCAYRTAM